MLLLQEELFEAIADCRMRLHGTSMAVYCNGMAVLEATVLC